MWRAKRDNILDDLLVETRFTESGSYTIKGSEWDDIEKAANSTPGVMGSVGLLPAMQIDIQHRRLLVLPLETYEDAKMEMAVLREELEECRARLK